MSSRPPIYSVGLHSAIQYSIVIIPTFYIVLAQRYVSRFEDVISDDQFFRIDTPRLSIRVLLVPIAMHELAIDARAGRVLKVVAKTDLFRRHFAH